VGQYSKMLSEYVGCPTNSSEKMLECLREKSAEEIIGYRKSILVRIHRPITNDQRDYFNK